MDNKNYNNQEEIHEESKSKLFIIVIIFLIFIFLVIGVSMAAFTYTKESGNVNTISTGNIYLDYTEDNNGINITNALPMTDATGKTLTDENQYFDFSVKAILTGDVVTDYEISAEKELNSTLDDNEVKLYLERKNGSSYEEVMAPKNFTPLKESTEIGTKVGSMILDSGSFSKTKTINYRLRMWMAEEAEVTNLQKTYAVRVTVKAKVNLAD